MPMTFAHLHRTVNHTTLCAGEQGKVKGSLGWHRRERLFFQICTSVVDTNHSITLHKLVLNTTSADDEPYTSEESFSAYRAMSSSSVVVCRQRRESVGVAQCKSELWAQKFPSSHIILGRF